MSMHVCHFCTLYFHHNTNKPGDSREKCTTRSTKPSFITAVALYVPRGQQQRGKVYEIPGFLEYRSKDLWFYVGGSKDSVLGFLSKFVRDSHPVAARVADPSVRTISKSDNKLSSLTI